jgi:hypothetical protein
VQLDHRHRRSRRATVIPGLVTLCLEDGVETLGDRLVRFVGRVLVDERSGPPLMPIDGRTTWVSVPRRTFLLGGIAAATAAAGHTSGPPRSTRRPLASAIEDAHPIEHLERVRLVLVESDNLLGPLHVIPTVHEHIGII